MIQLADQKTETEVRRMWKICFEDSDEFMDLYFSKKYKNQNTLIYIEEGKAVASLQILPYQFTFCGVEIPTSYISGACTLPEYRNRGYMGKLLLAAFKLMQERNIPLAILIPAEEWLYSYYARYGFETVFESDEKVIPLKEIIEQSNSNLNTAYSVFDKLFRNKDFCVQKTNDDFITIVQDAELDDFPSKTNLSGMARVIDINCLLSIYGMKHSKTICSLKIDDRIIEKNSGYYEINSGKFNAAKMSVKNPLCLDVSLLCRLLFGFRLNELPKDISRYFVPQQPIMNLMLE